MLLPSRQMVKNRVFAIRETERVTSTQDVVLRAARSGAGEGFTCLAAEQTTGRGRLGRRWVAPPASAMLASVLLRVADAAAPGVPFAAGLALSNALLETSRLETELKWPNDVLARGRKLAGLLAEVCPEAAPPGETAVIVGAGVNLTVPEFPAGVDGVSLHRLVQRPPSARALLEIWLLQLFASVARLERVGLPALLVDWRRRAAGLGRPVRVEVAGKSVEGVAVGVRDDGALLLRTAEGIRPVLAGDVHLMERESGTTRMAQR
jgi:BirA family biotin operon repressor/biotin-[acetyl-CoA-carboxylase] ligase